MGDTVLGQEEITNTPSTTTPTTRAPTERAPTPRATTPLAPTAQDPTPRATTPQVPQPLRRVQAPTAQAPTPRATTPRAPTAQAPTPRAITPQVLQSLGWVQAPSQLTPASSYVPKVTPMPVYQPVGLARRGQPGNIQMGIPKIGQSSYITPSTHTAEVYGPTTWSWSKVNPDHNSTLVTEFGGIDHLQLKVTAWALWSDILVRTKKVTSNPPPTYWTKSRKHKKVPVLVHHYHRKAAWSEGPSALLTDFTTNTSSTTNTPSTTTKDNVSVTL
jgi:hypothetical protein